LSTEPGVKPRAIIAWAIGRGRDFTQGKGGEDKGKGLALVRGRKGERSNISTVEGGEEAAYNAGKRNRSQIRQRSPSLLAMIFSFFRRVSKAGRQGVSKKFPEVSELGRSCFRELDEIKRKAAKRKGIKWETFIRSEMSILENETEKLIFRGNKFRNPGEGGTKEFKGGKRFWKNGRRHNHEKSGG